MKRIIKFRAWNKEENKMWSFDVMDRNKIFALDSNLPHKDFLVIPDGSHIELMQFTGLTDKNGKEIYDGDVVKYREGVYKVDWFENGFYLFRDVRAKFDIWWVETEVIGNIYENPELLAP